MNRFLSYLPVFVLLAVLGVVVVKPEIALLLFLSTEVVTALQVLTVMILFSVIQSRIQARDYAGWTWGYVFTICAILVTLLTAWIGRGNGGFSSIFSFLAALSWLQSSLSQSSRLKSTKYE